MLVENFPLTSLFKELPDVLMPRHKWFAVIVFVVGGIFTDEAGIQ